jgi:hypothetical protein
MKAVAVLAVHFLAAACHARELKQTRYDTVSEALQAAGGSRVSTLIAAVQVRPAFSELLTLHRAYNPTTCFSQCNWLSTEAVSHRKLPGPTISQHISRSQL